MLSPSPAALFVWGLYCLRSAAAYDLYNDTLAKVSATQTAEDGTYTGLAAYDPTVLNVPALPANPVREMAVTIPSNPQGAGYQLSIPQKGNFLGFSIELSVAANVMGSSGELLKPTFLNYMDNIRARAKAGPVIRVGGNSQEGSTLFLEGLDAPTEKYKSNLDTPTATPVINYSDRLFWLMSNISSLIDAEWFFGLAFNQTTVESRSTNMPLAAEHAQKILGSRLRGLAMGNEPDLYNQHQKRPEGYTLQNYHDEFNDMRNFVLDTAELPNGLDLIGPSVCCNIPGFDIWDVLNSGWLDDNLEYLATISVQHYPTNNCKINGAYINPNDIFATMFLTHESAINLTWPYIDSANRVYAAGKEMVMLEFNTASCGGFPGLSDSFGATLWLADWTLQMAWGNFSNALMHVGGQNVYYNPFTPPPYTNSRAGWTTGSVYYSALLVAEALGPTNTSQVVDYYRDRDNDHHPMYLIYENGVPARVVLFNYLSDANGGGDYTATISIDNAALDHVYVRYLSADSIVDQYNIKWANQSTAGMMASDGRLYGDVMTYSVQCTEGKCPIHVPGPSVALVFLNEDDLNEVNPPEDDAPFTTTMIDAKGIAVNFDDLQHSNGMNPNWKVVYGSPAAALEVQVGLVLLSAAAVFTLVCGL